MVLNIDKPFGWSSTDVVRKLRIAMLRAGYPKKVKIGHAGTLDPLATGVLIVCSEGDTKSIDEIQAQSKQYLFTLELGATTVSFDLEHPISERAPFEHITMEDVERVLKSYIGDLEQLPPLYSAKRIDGKRAYQYARTGETVEQKRASVTVFGIEVVDFQLPYLTLRVNCSKGTYVRSLVRDIGVDLDSCAHLTTLRRTASGTYRDADSLTIEQASQQLSDSWIYRSEV